MFLVNIKWFKNKKKRKINYVSLTYKKSKNINRIYKSFGINVIK